MENFGLKNVTETMALKSSYDPWAIPDDFSVYKSSPEWLQPLLHPHWQTQKAVHPFFTYFCGLYMLIGGIIAFAGNVMVLKIFGHNKALRTPANMLIVNLAVSDLGIVVGLFPECIYNFFLGGPWRFGYWGCQIHAFSGAFCGFSQIITLTFVAIDRYNVIVKGMSGTPLTYKKVTSWIAIGWIWSFFWAISPLAIGWGAPYAIDGMLGSCSYDMFTQDMNHKSFLMSMTCVVSFHILIIVACYFFIVRAVFDHEESLRAQAKKMNVTSLRSTPEQQQLSAEMRAAKVAIMNVTLWIITWAPFVVNAMFGVWGNPSFINPIVSEIPILFAKTSCCWNPIIYALSHPKLQQSMKELYPWVCIADTRRKTITDNESVETSEAVNITEKPAKA